MSVTTVRLPPDVNQSLENIARRLERTKSWIINRAVSEFIQKQQQEQDRWEQTLQAMESAANGKVVDASRVHEWLASWGEDNELEAPSVK